MGLLDRLFAVEQRGFNSASDFWFTSINDYAASKAGVYVTRETAMRCATVYACVRVLAEDLSSLPCILYRRLPGGGRERATDHWAYDLLHRQAGPRLTAGQWVETSMYHMALVGNHYSLIERDNGGEVKQLYPLQPEWVEFESNERGEMIYRYRPPSGKQYVYGWDQMLHIPAMSWDGVIGISPISHARETIGLTIAAEEFGERFYANGTNIGTIYSHGPGVRMGPEETTKFEEDLKEKHAGLSRSHSALILPPGMTVTKVNIPPNDAQFLETRKFQKAEIASIFRVPLHLIQEHEKNTSWGTGIEQMSQGYVTHTLRPWMVRIERMLNLKLLQGPDAQKYYFEFLADGLLRGDNQSRAMYFTSAIQSGWLSRNEVREIENRNPVEGGDEFLVPLNMSVAGEPQPEPTAEPEPAEEKSACGCGQEHRQEKCIGNDHPRMSIQRSYRRVIADALSRVIRRERNDILKGVGKYTRKAYRSVEQRNDAVAGFITEFYESHETFTEAAIRPAFTALAEAIGAQAMREIEESWEWNAELERWLEGFIQSFSRSHVGRSRGQLLAILAELGAEDDIVAALTDRFDEWENGGAAGRPRSDRAAEHESVRLGEGFAREAFFAAGIATLVWAATGSDTCPYCQSLNGRVITINDVFIAAGQAFDPEGADSPLVPGLDIGHPPAHAGCDCILIPGG